MPDVTTIISNAPIACVLAGNDIANGSLFGQRQDPKLAIKIYATYIVIKKIYDNNSNYTGMVAACNYLWELMGKYGVQALNYTSGGGVVPPITPPISSFPIVVTGGDFEPDGVSYNNPNIVGFNLMLFIGGYNQEWHFAPTDFSYTSTGFIITIPSFNANNYNYITIQNFISN